MESPSEQLLALTYAVDKVLNITEITEQHEASGPSHLYSYGYDALDRLTSATYPTALGLPASEAFAYDDAGNREDPADPSAYAYDANNRITASPGKVWVYDGDGNPVSVNAALGSEKTFTHDASNRMRGYANAATSTAATYLYDPFARRIRKTVDASATWFLWDGDRLLAEFDSSGDRERRYTHAMGFAPAEQVIAGASGEEAQPVHADHLDTPRGLSDGGGYLVWRGAHRAFGPTAANEDPDGDLVDVRFSIRFPGQFEDGESGLHYNRFRYYDPTIGRYTSGDPLGQFVGGLTDVIETDGGFEVANVLTNHLFNYVDNGPVSWIDWHGWAKGKNKGGKGRRYQNKNKRKGSENRQPTGARERNVGHPNAEEHARVPRGRGGRGVNPTFRSLGAVGLALDLLGLLLDSIPCPSPKVDPCTGVATYPPGCFDPTTDI